METKIVQVIVRAAEGDDLAMTDKFQVVSYGLADGVAVLKFPEGSEHRIKDAVGFYTGVKAAV